MNKYNTIIGMDLGDRTSYWALMTADSAEIHEEGKIGMTEKAIRRKFSSMEPVRIAIEVGTHSRWVSQLLEECGHEVLVANARKVRLIYDNVRKNDRIDAQTLARIARLDPYLLSPIRHRGESAQADLALLRARDALVRSRTILINHLRGVVKSFGGRLPKCSADSLHKRAKQAIPEELQPALGPIVSMIAELSSRIAEYDKEVERLCKEAYPETEVFTELKGVGPLTSLAFVLTLEDPGHFASSRDVGPYLGLVPGRDQSGGLDPQLGITKAGDAFLRRLLVQAAQYVLGELNTQDSELRQWGLKLAGPKDRKGKHNKRLKKRAVVAVARKLAVLLHTLWRDGAMYEPFYQHQQQEARKAAACNGHIHSLSPLPSPQRGEATARSTKHPQKSKVGREAHGPRPMPVYSPR
jgi:transposase